MRHTTQQTIRCTHTVIHAQTHDSSHSGCTGSNRTGTGGLPHTRTANMPTGGGKWHFNCVGNFAFQIDREIFHADANFSHTSGIHSDLAQTPPPPPPPHPVTCQRLHCSSEECCKLGHHAAGFEPRWPQLQKCSRYIFAQSGQNVPAEKRKPPAGTFSPKMAKMYRLRRKNLLRGTCGDLSWILFRCAGRADSRETLCRR